mmetsp:Transcript_49306/g.79571  ORF Transcript_49306/g.79571 Transcript_49306/m.79571 type:complete len:102 (+) Transcript_49306:866-1171(+)
MPKCGIRKCGIRKCVASRLASDKSIPTCACACLQFHVGVRKKFRMSAKATEYALAAHPHTQTAICACMEFRMGVRGKIRMSAKVSKGARATLHAPPPATAD